MMPFKNPWISVLILILLALIWGSSFILIKKTLLYFSPSETASLRISIASLFLMPFALLRLKRLSKKQHINIGVAGMAGSLLPAFLFAFAQTQINSAMAGILNSLTPLFTLILGVALFQIPAQKRQLAGILIGLTGAVGISMGDFSNSASWKVLPVFLIMLATFCYAFNVNWIKKKLLAVDALTITALSFAWIGPFMIAYLLGFTGFLQKLKDPQNYTGLIYVGILSIFGTGLALIAFNKLIKISSPVFAASVTYLIPVVAVIWGIWDGERFSLYFPFWAGLILAGVFLSRGKQLKRK